MLQQSPQPQLVLEITSLWEQPRGIYNYHNDNLHAFKAAAELSIGHFDQARVDIGRVLEARKTQGLWAENLDALADAVAKRQKSFIYRPGNLPSGWSLFRSDDFE